MSAGVKVAYLLLLDDVPQPECVGREELDCLGVVDDDDSNCLKDS